MKSIRILGVDPGIANTGLAVVRSTGDSYELEASRCVKTKPSERETERLLRIHQHALSMLEAFRPIDGVFIEAVYFGKNVSSCIKTAKVIGAVAISAACEALEVHYLTPQQVKKASGFGGSANKDAVKRAASGIFRQKLQSDHEADAALVALAGVLKLRSEACTRKLPNNSGGYADHEANPQKAF